MIRLRDDEERDTVKDPATDPAESGRAARERTAAEPARRPVPGVKHEPEPDAGNIMPAEDEPGTM